MDTGCRTIGSCRLSKLRLRNLAKLGCHGSGLFTQLPLCIWSEVDFKPLSSFGQKLIGISYLVFGVIIVFVRNDLH
jgi:hypothetical protein